jgi:hypothetical protein
MWKWSFTVLCSEQTLTGRCFLLLTTIKLSDKICISNKQTQEWDLCKKNQLVNSFHNTSYSTKYNLTVFSPPRQLKFKVWFLLADQITARQHSPSRSPRFSTLNVIKTALSQPVAANDSSDWPDLVIFIQDASKDDSHGSHTLSLDSHWSRMTYFSKDVFYPSMISASLFLFLIWRPNCSTSGLFPMSPDL